MLYLDPGTLQLGDLLPYACGVEGDADCDICALRVIKADTVKDLNRKVKTNFKVTFTFTSQPFLNELSASMLSCLLLPFTITQIHGLRCATVFLLIHQCHHVFSSVELEVLIKQRSVQIFDFSDKKSERAKDMHLLKRLTMLLKNREVDSGTIKQTSMCPSRWLHLCLTSCDERSATGMGFRATLVHSLYQWC